MNLTVARNLLPISNRLDRSPKLNYLPRPLLGGWWRPRVTLVALNLARLLARRGGRQ